jgi:hypothetical protein
LSRAALLRPWPVARLALAACALVAAALPAAQDAPPSDSKVLVSDWSYTRERKTTTTINRVTLGFTVKNTAAQPLESVCAKLTLLSGLGEKAGGPFIRALGRLRPGQAMPVQIVGELAPAFSAYEIQISFTGGKELWYSPSESAQPLPRPNRLEPDAADVVVLGEEAAVDRLGRFSGRIRVRNDGALDARDVKLLVTFHGLTKAGKKTKLRDWTGPLGDGLVPAGRELVVPFAVPGQAPAGMAGYELRVITGENLEAQLSGGQFTNATEVEAAHWQFRRSGANQEDLQVSCQVRNGLAQPVENIRVKVNFLAGERGARNLVRSHVQELRVTLAPGAAQAVSFTIKHMPRYDGYEAFIEYDNVGGAPAATQPPAFTNADTVEVLFCEFQALPDDAVQVSCAARNGRPHQVKDVSVTLRFLKADGSELCRAEKVLREPMLTGEQRRFVIRAEGAKGYARYEGKVRFQELLGPAP